MPETAESIHLNARVRGMKSALFAQADLEEMLQQGDLQRMIDRLLDSPYRTELAEALTRNHGADAIEEAVSRNLVQTFNGLSRRAQGEMKELVELFLQRWDLAAVKSLLRMRHHNLDPQEFGASLLPGPTLTVPLLNEFSGLDSMDALVVALSGWNRLMTRPLANALAQYRETHDLALLEDALDRHYFAGTVKLLNDPENSDGQMLRDYLRMEIDRINLRTVLSYVAGGKTQLFDAEDLLPQGRLSRQFLQELAGAPDLPAAVERLGNTAYAQAVEELYPLMQTHRFAPLERFLERIILLELRRMGLRDVFGLGIVMDYVWRKYNEVVNLRLIARGLAGNLPVGRVREALNLV